MLIKKLFSIFFVIGGDYAEIIAGLVKLGEGLADAGDEGDLVKVVADVVVN